jgi:hypothetical protein
MKYYLMLLTLLYACKKQDDSCDFKSSTVSLEITKKCLSNPKLNFEGGFNQLGYIEFPFNLNEIPDYKLIEDNPCPHYLNVIKILKDKNERTYLKLVAIHSMKFMDLKNYYKLIDIVIKNTNADMSNDVLLADALYQDIISDKLKKDKNSDNFKLMLKKVNKLNLSEKVKGNLKALIEK